MSILNGLAWEAVDHAPSADGLPTVTHEGTLEIAGHRLRCYRLDNGQAIINADDFHAFFGDMGVGPASATPAGHTKEPQ